MTCRLTGINARALPILPRRIRPLFANREDTVKLIFGGAALVLIIGASEFMWIWVLHTAEIEVWEETYEAGGIKEE